MKRNIFFCFGLAICLLAVTSCRQKKTPEKHTGTEYYKNILPLFSFHDEEKGVGRIDSTEAAKISSYKFRYNESGKPASVEYTKNDTLVDSPVLGCAKVKYAYDGPMQVKFFFNSGEQPVEYDGIFAFQYSINSAGERSGMMFLDKDGVMVNNKNGVHAWQWTRTDDDIIKETRYSLDGNEVLPEALLRYNHDGELSEIRYIGKDGESINDPATGIAITKFRYDRDGNCIETLKFDKNDTSLN